jgi:hypothetical protein
MNINKVAIERIKKILSLCTVFAVWFASVYFSNMGFGIQIPKFAFIGWILAFAVTIVEVNFNSQLTYKHTNFTLYVLGISAYLYGIASNFSGLWFATTGSVNMNNIGDNFISAIFTLFIAIFIEILPETLMVLAIAGVDGSGDGDFIRNILGIRSEGGSSSGNQGNQNNRSSQNGQNNNNRSGNTVMSEPRHMSNVENDEDENAFGKPNPMNGNNKGNNQKIVKPYTPQHRPGR